MELPQEIDDFIKHTIDHTIGLPIPDHSLQLKLQSLETTLHRLQSQYLDLLSKFKAKDEALQLAKSESTINAQALKKFVEENQKLAKECANLVNQCSQWKSECSLYEEDREKLMDFGNQADARATVAEVTIGELEAQLKQTKEEFDLYKRQHVMPPGGSSEDGNSSEQTLLNDLVASVVNKNDEAKTALAFLEANSRVESCRRLHEMWNYLKPETRHTISLAAHAWTLQTDKEHLRINLHRAEDEVKVLFEENNVLERENKKLLKMYNSERKHSNSGGKRGSSSATKGNKRKTSPGTSSPVEKKIDFNDIYSPRHPLSPLKENSPPGSKSHKK